MREILFLSHRIPFPPDRGDKIRSHHILKRLIRLAPVHVATFADDELDRAEEAELASVASSYALVQRSKPIVVAGAESMFSGKPISLHAFHDPAIAAFVAHTLASRTISAIYVFSGQMGQYVPADFSGRVITDFVDVDSAKFDAYGERGNPLLRWVYRREGRLLSAEEARLASASEVNLLISDDEAQLFRQRLPQAELQSARVEVLGNGIDSVSYDPALIDPETAMLSHPGPRIIFTGQMDYAPNVEAALRMIRRILPLVRKTLPDATFHVVGRNPGADLLEHDGEAGVKVWGRVEDVRTWLKAADMAVVPLEIARGVQNKVLEAMSMALPVVLTRHAASGIPATDGLHFSVADSDEAIAKVVVDLADNQRSARVMGLAARRFVVANASWQSALAPLPRLVGWSGGPYRDAA
jgi:polysaccharide biosynthesis protein PslH